MFPLRHHPIQSTNLAKCKLSCSDHVVSLSSLWMHFLACNQHASSVSPTTVLPKRGCRLESHGDLLKLLTPDRLNYNFWWWETSTSTLETPRVTPLQKGLETAS